VSRSDVRAQQPTQPVTLANIYPEFQNSLACA
jgi:hypothetical protein